MQKIMGKNLFEVADTDDKLFRKEIVEVAKKKCSGWVDLREVESVTTDTGKLQKVVRRFTL